MKEITTIRMELWVQVFEDSFKRYGKSIAIKYANDVIKEFDKLFKK